MRKRPSEKDTFALEAKLPGGSVAELVLPSSSSVDQVKEAVLSGLSTRDISVLAAEGRERPLDIDFIRFVDSDATLRSAFDQGKPLRVVILPTDGSIRTKTASLRAPFPGRANGRSLPKAYSPSPVSHLMKWRSLPFTDDSAPSSSHVLDPAKLVPWNSAPFIPLPELAQPETSITETNNDTLNSATTSNNSDENVTIENSTTPTPPVRPMRTRKHTVPILPNQRSGLNLTQPAPAQEVADPRLYLSSPYKQLSSHRLRSGSFGSLASDSIPKEEITEELSAQEKKPKEESTSFIESPIKYLLSVAAGGNLTRPPAIPPRSHPESDSIKTSPPIVVDTKEEKEMEKEKQEPKTPKNKKESTRKEKEEKEEKKKESTRAKKEKERQLKSSRRQEKESEPEFVVSDSTLVSTRMVSAPPPFPWHEQPISKRQVPKPRSKQISELSQRKEYQERAEQFRLSKAESEEAHLFRYRMRRLVPLFKTGGKSYGLIEAPIGPSSFYHPESDQIAVHFKFAGAVYASVQPYINCSGEETINSILERILSKMKKKEDERVEDKIVQISGYSYLFVLNGEVQLKSLCYVQQCLQKGMRVEFCIWNREDPSLPCQLPPLNAKVPYGHERLRKFDWLTDEDLGLDLVEQEIIEVKNLHKCFEVKVLCVENYNPTLLEKCPELNGKVAKVALFVNISLYVGSHLLREAVTTERQPVPIWAEWVNTNVILSSIPEETIMCLTVFAATEGDPPVPVGSVLLPIFDFYGILLTGIQKLRLWPLVTANPIGPRSQNPDLAAWELVIEIDKPPRPVAITPPSTIKLQGVKKARHGCVLKMPSQEEITTIDTILKKHAMDPLTREEKEKLWQWKEYCVSIVASPSLLMTAVPWADPIQRAKARRMLATYGLIDPLDALQLLGGAYGDTAVREYAVRCLVRLTDEQIVMHINLLVQLLKFEPNHDSALARFLLFRALQNPTLVGHFLFWALKVEMGEGIIVERCALLVEIFLWACHDKQLRSLATQSTFVGRLHMIADTVKFAKKAERTNLLQELLVAFLAEFMPTVHEFQLPLRPAVLVTGLDVGRCKCLGSNAAPLWLVFKNKDDFGPPLLFIFKSGDDLRQDALTMQMFGLMDQLWKGQGYDMHMSIYSILSTDKSAGFIEIVHNSTTAAKIQKDAAGMVGALQKTPLRDWLHKHNPTKIEYEHAVNNFVHSCAGYSVASYILGLGDRHNDNIMITQEGHLFHIDFAHFLGNIMTFGGYKREKGPFVFTPEFMHVMGDDEDSSHYKLYLDLCCNGYNVLRQKANMFIMMFTLMLWAGIPQLQKQEDIIYLRDAMTLHLSDEEAAAAFKKLVEISLNTKTTQVLFFMHNLVHPD